MSFDDSQQRIWWILEFYCNYFTSLQPRWNKFNAFMSWLFFAECDVAKIKIFQNSFLHLLCIQAINCIFWRPCCNKYSKVLLKKPPKFKTTPLFRILFTGRPKNFFPYFFLSLFFWLETNFQLPTLDSPEGDLNTGILLHTCIHWSFWSAYLTRRPEQALYLIFWDISVVTCSRPHSVAGIILSYSVHLKTKHR